MEQSINTSLEFDHKLTSMNFDTHVGNTTDLELDVTNYQKLGHLPITRPDVNFEIQV